MVSSPFRYLFTPCTIGPMTVRNRIVVHLGTPVTAETIARQAPDVVVIATGSRPSLLDLPISGGAQVVEVRAILAEEVPVRAGQRVVVVAGEHHIQALSTADFLAAKGCRVEVLSEALYAGAQLEAGTLELLYGRLLRQRVTITPLTAVTAVDGQTVTTTQPSPSKNRPSRTLIWSFSPMGDRRRMRAPRRCENALGRCM